LANLFFFLWGLWACKGVRIGVGARSFPFGLSHE